MAEISVMASAARALRRHIDARVAAAGYAAQGSIPEGMSFLAWCEDLGKRGLKIDKKPFRLDNRPALLPVYAAIPTTTDEAYKRTLVIQKATQLNPRLKVIGIFD